ncbi:hypothetical protein [Pseudoalteromonas sp. NC201]|uniref:hypothetical protein n=1 Tax=Pseudoalteromonas sp. NC201 TaxID=1514074 RepID=UPI000C7BDB07|nr:hypothetical protein [Pseudoalteromonas sp. NC201]AUJ72418.1 hypothetical protein PNC201_21010 [Pseudoalteromonas sp. NC201]
MTQFETILLGVAAGILTTMTIFIAKGIWLKIILPSYQSARYQGADISGSWEKDYENKQKGTLSSFSFVIKQNAHDVSGSLYFVHKSPEKNFSVDYELIGEYWEGYLTLSCRSKDRRVFSQGAIFLKLTNNGKAFNGYFSFRNSSDDIVSSNKLELKRN